LSRKSAVSTPEKSAEQKINIAMAISSPARAIEVILGVRSRDRGIAAFESADMSAHSTSYFQLS
jgi:hypothetical protein